MSNTTLGDCSVCVHGSLRRDCPICERNDRIAELETDNRQLDRLRMTYERKIEELEAGYAARGKTIDAMEADIEEMHAKLRQAESHVQQLKSDLAAISPVQRSIGIVP